MPSRPPSESCQRPDCLLSPCFCKKEPVSRSRASFIFAFDGDVPDFNVADESLTDLPSPSDRPEPNSAFDFPDRLSRSPPLPCLSRKLAVLTSEPPDRIVLDELKSRLPDPIRSPDPRLRSTDLKSRSPDRKSRSPDLKPRSKFPPRSPMEIESDLPLLKSPPPPLKSPLPLRRSPPPPLKSPPPKSPDRIT